MVDSAPPPVALGAANELVLVLPTAPTSERAVHVALTACADAACWPGEAADDILLAANEAVANVIDHAYPAQQAGTIRMHTWISATSTTASIEDPAVARRYACPAFRRGSCQLHGQPRPRAGTERSRSSGVEHTMRRIPSIAGVGTATPNASYRPDPPSRYAAAAGWPLAEAGRIRHSPGSSASADS